MKSLDEIEKAAKKAIRDNWYGAAFQEAANPETVLRLIAVARAVENCMIYIEESADVSNAAAEYVRTMRKALKQLEPK